jgi:glutamate-1-semialdehyde aminotransferase
VHFTPKSELIEYRDLFSDDAGALRRLVVALLEEGVYILPDGRLYVSVVHSEEDAAATVAAFDRAFARLGADPGSSGEAAVSTNKVG